MPELDLDNLGTLAASATNAARYRFLLVEAGATNAEALKANPAFDGAQVVMSSEMPDAGGKSDLAMQALRGQIEEKLAKLAADKQVEAFVIGFGEAAGDVAVAKGPTFTRKGAKAEGGELNEYVLKAINGVIPRGGKYKWDASTNGTSKDLSYDNQRVAHGDGQHTFCCGMAFEAWLTACELFYKEKTGSFSKIHQLSVNNVIDIRSYFFIAKGGGIWGGAQAAFPRYQIGREVSEGEFKPGDFVQIWRGTPGAEGVSGHSVVFLSWNEGKGGKQIHYWSTQPSTGVGECTETVQSSWKLFGGRCILPAPA